jgi:UDP-GlcNAc:undecaprenyl-phosphate GlcNAc-1-phosphate transferase
MRKGWMANPTKERWHRKPTALFGGIAIYIGISVPLFFIADFHTIIPHIFRISYSAGLPSIGAVIFIGTTLLFVIGLLDDFINIKPHTKLVGQILVASMVTFLGFRLHWFSSLTIDTMVTIFWVVGITNAFNLIDNMDGLCAGVGVISAIFLSLLFKGSMGEASVISMIIAGSLGGFLFYNFNPASIFMGDCGSLVIGFSLSMLGLAYSEVSAAHSLSLYAVPIMIFMVPILDTTMVTSVRLLSGRRASKGGKDHTSHRLVLMGFNEKKAVLFLYGICAVSGMSALFTGKTDTFTSPAVIVPVVVSILLMTIYLAQLRVYPEKEFSLLRDKPYTPILIELTYKRQIVLVILDMFLISFAYYLSYRLRFSGAAFPFYFKIFLKSLPAVIACKLLAFYTLGIYRAIWGSMSTTDVYAYVKASSLATIFSIVAVTFMYRFEDFSKGIFLIDWLLTTGFILGTRGSFRLFLEVMKRKSLFGDTVLIYGAGKGGEILLREILNNEKIKIKPVGFVDDDPLKAGKKLLGYPIFGTFNDLDYLCEKYKVGGLVISFRDKDSNKYLNIKDFCRINNLFLKYFSIDLEDVDLEI